MVTINNKTVCINGINVCMDYVPRKIIESDFGVIILFYDETIIANNVVAYSMTGEKLWSVNDILEIKKPRGNVDIDLIDNKTLKVISSLGIDFIIDIEKKSLIEKKHTK